MESTSIVRIANCLRCGHQWAMKVSYPRVCPKCRSPYWDRERRIPKAQRNVDMQVSNPVKVLKTDNP